MGYFLCIGGPLSAPPQMSTLLISMDSLLQPVGSRIPSIHFRPLGGEKAKSEGEEAEGGVILVQGEARQAILNPGDNFSTPYSANAANRVSGRGPVSAAGHLRAGQTEKAAKEAKAPEDPHPHPSPKMQRGAKARNHPTSVPGSL